MNRVRFSVVTVGLLAALQSIALADASYSDAIFKDPDWVISENHNGALGSVTGVQQLAGGNPNEYRRVNHNNFTFNLYSYHAYNGAIYTPSTQGAIASIDWSQDAMAIINHAGIGVLFRLLVSQGGNNFMSTQSGFNNNFNWATIGATGITQNDFFTWNNPSLHPDFSVNGGPIQFGFVAVNDNGGFNTSRAAGVDNWLTTVHTVPEPATLLLLPFALFAGIRSRRRAC